MVNIRDWTHDVQDKKAGGIWEAVGKDGIGSGNKIIVTEQHFSVKCCTI